MRLAEIGARIREARRSLGWTQETLAERAGISRPTLNQLENGVARDLGAAKILRLLDAVGLELIIITTVSRRSPDHVSIAVTAANVGFKTSLTEDELVRALLTGVAPERKRPHLRRLFEDSPASLLRNLQEQVGKWTKPGKVRKNFLKLARALGVEADPSWQPAP